MINAQVVDPAAFIWYRYQVQRIAQCLCIPSHMDEGKRYQRSEGICNHIIRQHPLHWDPSDSTVKVTDADINDYVVSTKTCSKTEERPLYFLYIFQFTGKFGRQRPCTEFFERTQASFRADSNARFLWAAMLLSLILAMTINPNQKSAAAWPIPWPNCRPVPCLYPPG